MTIRPCLSVEELAGCARLQQEIWGYTESEAYPVRLFINLLRVGGHTLGAFTPQGTLAGFVVSMPAWHGRRRYYHSLSLGVKTGYENRGLGKALKLAQRDATLKEGIDLIEWTFDPLRAKNAFFNIERLGAVARRYIPDYYGHVESRLQLGLPSDRLIAEWRLKSARVKRFLNGKSARFLRKPPAAEVEIPSDLDALVRKDPEGARSWQATVCERLQELFAQGLAITGFQRGEITSRYLLDRL